MDIGAILTTEQLKRIRDRTANGFLASRKDNFANIYSLLDHQDALWDLLDEFDIEWIHTSRGFYCSQCGGWRDATEDTKDYSHGDKCPHRLLAEAREKAGRE